jgi:UDP-2,4-diacetamido-2,4,6-trideoxy-beta-L-altropyranose hydrolase
MQVVFRTDASPVMGAGHLMRCLALAAELRSQGATCIFLCRGQGLGGLADRIFAEGHRLVSLPEAATAVPETDDLPHAAWLPGGQMQDAARCLAALESLGSQGPADWLVVDHYAIDHRWETAMRGAARRTMVIDDLADRQHACELLLDQNLVEGMQVRYEGRVPPGCTTLLGPRYALLRAEFASGSEGPADAAAAAGATRPERVLVMFGGADAADLTLRTLAAIAQADWPGPLDVVVGPLYQRLENLCTLAATLPQATIHVAAAHVSTLMNAAGLAIGSPGMSSWERCACGLPALAIAQADNQEGIGRALADAAAHWYLGRSESMTDELLVHSLQALLGNPDALQSMARNARRLCDGRGARRVSRLMADRASLQLRVATAADAQLLFGWRNDPRTRRHSRNGVELELTQHLQWFDRVLNEDRRLLLLGCLGTTPVGCVRFDLDGTSAEVSIYLDPDRQGSGLGRSLLRAALDFLHAQHPGVQVCRAEVMSENAASAALFARSGFSLHSQWFERHLT